METIKNAIKWFFKTTFTVIIVFVVLLFFLTAIIAKLSYENIMPKEISKGSYIVLKFPDGLLESPLEQFNFQSFKASDLNRKTLILSDVLQGISHASKDTRINGIILDLNNWNIALEHTSEITKSLEKFKESKKSVIAIGSQLGKGNYLAALAGNEIILDPSNSSTVFISGFNISVPYFKDMGDKLGISVNVIHIGQYKGAGENFARNNMSDQYRVSIERIIGDRLDLFTSSVSDYRKIEKTTVSDMIEKGEMVFITPEEALSMKLVDKLMSYDDFISERNIKTKQILNIEDYNEYADVIYEDKIAVIMAEGNIVDSNGSMTFSDETINPEKFEKIISKIKKDKDIKAVVLRVNSPGGSALASEKILRKIKDLKKSMPVVVSMGSMAASGGYYISCQGTKIYADPYTITGSIGVVSMIPNIKNLYDKIGINSERIVKGKYSDMFDFTKEQSEDDITVLRKAMEKIYIEFKSRVSEGRKIN
ncbi:MAG: signal peptide peptidase SppA, partial [Candidatus Delongbacteria bacterium]|nr:signal peptide peptidase SppA [Candidatus Delongbacteria bacterium]